MSKILKAAVLTGVFTAFAGATAQAQNPRDSTMPPAVTAPAPGQPSAGPSVQEGADHKAEAVKHTQAAVDAGKSGSATGVADHAQVALTHAQAISKEQPGPEITATVKSLEDAVSKGKSGDAEGATKAAQEALSKLQPKK